MHPILFSIFGYPIPSFGVMVALGFILAIMLCLYRAPQYNLTTDSVITWIPRLLLIGLLGAKIAFFLYFPSLLLNNPWQAITYPGGLVLYGGIILGIVGLYVWAKQEEISFWKLTDFLSIPMLTGLAFGRIGCFLSGCCYGSPCNLPWAVQYPPEHLSHPQLVHPAPLYASLLVFLLMGLLLILETKKWPPLALKHKGKLSALFLAGYGLIRIGMEALRDDRITIIETIPLSASQWVSVIAILIGTWLFYRASSSTQKENPVQPTLPTV